ncbi:MAG: hypothetical protein ACMG6E_06030 [Candidatus Roizmanbacteria bacterium]
MLAVMSIDGLYDSFCLSDEKVVHLFEQNNRMTLAIEETNQPNGQIRGIVLNNTEILALLDNMSRIQEYGNAVLEINAAAQVVNNNQIHRVSH